MKVRTCDGCRKCIPIGEDYYKVCEQKHEGKKQTLNHVGDLCEKCWNRITNQ